MSKKTASKPVPLQSVTARYLALLVTKDCWSTFSIRPPEQVHLSVCVCVVCLTRWPEAYALPNITAPTFAQAFLDAQISSFGVPARIHLVQAHQECSLFCELCTPLQICKSRTMIVLLHLVFGGYRERIGLCFPGLFV